MHFGNGFPISGLSTVDVTYPFKMPAVWFDDFNAIGVNDFSNAATAAGSLARYYLGGNTGGAAPTMTAATLTFVTSSDGGRLRFITTANANDTMVAKPPGGFLRAAVSSTDPRPVVFQGKLIPTAVAASSQGMGLCTVAGVNGTTTPIVTQAFGFYFVIVNGAVQVSYKTSAVTFAAAAVTYLEGPNTGSAVTVAAGGELTLGIRWDGASNLKFFVNGLLVKNVTLASFTSIDLAPFWGVLGNAQTCDFDYVYAACQEARAGRY